jgi:hypothetical protein
LICVGLPILQIITRACVQPFTISKLFTEMQTRLRCFAESLQHI